MDVVPLPCEHAALQIYRCRETIEFEEHAGLAAAIAGTAVDDDLSIAIRFEFIDAVGKLPERNEDRPGDVLLGMFLGLSYVEQDDVFACSESGFQCVG